MSDTPIYDKVKKGDLTMPANTQTPNIVIENPSVRRNVRLAIDIVGTAILAVMAFDTFAEWLDITPVTIPALATWGLIRQAFGYGVDNPNTPKA